MTVPLGEPDIYADVWRNQFQVKDARQKPGALRWWQPDCVYGDVGDCAECYPGCHGDEPVLVNGWAQPTNASGLEKFAFRLHTDGSLEFKGHLDAFGASSGTIAFTLPGAALGDEDFLPANDQFFHTTITDDSGLTFTLALVRINQITGAVTISWPAVG